MSGPTQMERWFYLDGFDANEFCPLWRYIDRFSIWMNPPANWCQVHYEAADVIATIEVPPGNFYPWALDQVSAHINTARGSPPFPEAEAAGGGGNSPDVRSGHSG